MIATPGRAARSGSNRDGYEGLVFVRKNRGEAANAVIVRIR